MLEVDVPLTADLNTIKFQGNTSAPNFMAMIVTQIPKHTVTIKDTDGSSSPYDVEDGKIVICKSTAAVAWKVNDVIVAMGKEFSFVPSEAAVIEAVEIQPDMKATGAVVTGTDLANNKFVVTYGSGLSTTDSVTITFTASDGAYGSLTVPVTEDIIGKQVEYTIADSAKTVAYVQVKTVSE
ncbi:MAG: hypothetical protein ACI4CT_07430 [Lachnospiraceae bacterium]